LKTKGVLFDFGGTLLEYNQEQIFLSLLKEREIITSREEVARAFTISEAQWYREHPELRTQPVTDEILLQWNRMILENLGMAHHEDLAQFIRNNWERMDEQLPKTLVRRAFPDARPCLEAISGLGLRMGMVSNIESEQRLRKELELVRLSEFFPVLVASGSIGYAKPAREIFDIAAKLVQLMPEEILFVGDDPERDYHGALGAGMSSVLIDRTERYSDLAGVRRVSSLEQVPTLTK